MKYPAIVTVCHPKTMRGFALPIVIVISTFASSLLGLDLYRLQAQAKLARLEWMKNQLLLVAEVESQYMVSQLNDQQRSHQCSISHLKEQGHLCFLQEAKISNSFELQSVAFQVSLHYRPGPLHATDFGIMTTELSLNNAGQAFTWQRYAYVTAVAQASPLIARSALVQDL